MGNTGNGESARKIRLVIIEKHPAVRRALRGRLEAAPHLTVVADVSEPAAALPYLNPAGFPEKCDSSPEAVLLGLHNGPDEELFDTLKVVQKMAQCPTAVIVLAPYADEVERLLMQQAGASRYLLKYIDSHQLISEIESAVYCGRKAIAG
jgi:DNA-binding NarL/FixJ family response regulator